MPDYDIHETDHDDDRTIDYGPLIDNDIGPDYYDLAEADHHNRTDGDDHIKPIDYDNLVANYKHYRRLFHDLAHILNDRTGEHHHHRGDNDLIVCTHNCADDGPLVVYGTGNYNNDNAYFGPRLHDHDDAT